MAGTSSHDDGFREIQLSGKQLVFLFMAVTVVLVVTFLTGVLVGRGVRVERSESAQAGALIDAPATPDRIPSTSTDAAVGDPRSAAPPAQAEDAGTPDAKTARIAQTSELAEEPQVAVKRSAPGDMPAVALLKPATPPAKVAATAVKAVPAAAGATTESADRVGFAVQVAAVNARGEADAIVKRLTGKGYAAYMEEPKGGASMFRVRVGTFKTRREAQTVADKLKKEEKFKPWVTR